MPQGPCKRDSEQLMIDQSDEACQVLCCMVKESAPQWVLETRHWQLYAWNQVRLQLCLLYRLSWMLQLVELALLTLSQP